MSGPPENPALKSMWTELAQAGYDPDEIIEQAARNGAEGGLHLDQLPTLVSSLCDGFDDWEYLWVYGGPTSLVGDHHYEFAHFIVEWNDEEGQWLPETQNTTVFDRYSTRLSDDLFTVSANDAKQGGESPLARRVTGVRKDELPSLVDTLRANTETASVEVQFTFEPDPVGEHYEFSYEFLRWEGDESGGEWASLQ